MKVYANKMIKALKTLFIFKIMALMLFSCSDTPTQPKEETITIVKNLEQGSNYFAIGSKAKYCCEPDSLGHFPVKVTYYVTKITRHKIQEAYFVAYIFYIYGDPGENREYQLAEKKMTLIPEPENGWQYLSQVSGEMITDGYYPGNIYYGQGILVLTDRGRIEYVPDWNEPVPNLHNLAEPQI
jgi:hypothetical protein